MKLKYLVAMFAAAILLAACVLETSSPEPTAVPPTAAVAPTLPFTSGTGSGATTSGGPAKQMVDAGGILIPQYPNAPPVTIDPEAKYSAVIRTTKGSMEFELFAEHSPITVNNFIFLANDGFYDGIIFHRVIPEFMVQGGDPTGTGTAGPGYRFEDEFAASLIFDVPGKLAMANSGPNTNGSQFFVTTAQTPHLNGKHTIFGQVIQGQEVADAISLAETDAGNQPTTPIVILGIDIVRNP